jgi:hypothetical protein
MTPVPVNRQPVRPRTGNGNILVDERFAQRTGQQNRSAEAVRKNNAVPAPQRFISLNRLPQRPVPAIRIVCNHNVHRGRALEKQSDTKHREKAC